MAPNRQNCSSFLFVESKRMKNMIFRNDQVYVFCAKFTKQTANFRRMDDVRFSLDFSPKQPNPRKSF